MGCRARRFITSVSRYTRDRMLGAWARIEPWRLRVLPNTFGSAFTSGPALEVLKARYGLGDRCVLLSISRLSRNDYYKGHDRVIEAMPDILQAISDLVYLIGGDGESCPTFSGSHQALAWRSTWFLLANPGKRARRPLSACHGVYPPEHQGRLWHCFHRGGCVRHSRHRRQHGWQLGRPSGGPPWVGDRPIRSPAAHRGSDRDLCAREVKGGLDGRGVLEGAFHPACCGAGSRARSECANFRKYLAMDYGLGHRLSARNHMRSDARFSEARKLASLLGYRVATPRKCLSLLKNRSTALRWRSSQSEKAGRFFR